MMHPAGVYRFGPLIMLAASLCRHPVQRYGSSAHLVILLNSVRSL